MLVKARRPVASLAVHDPPNASDFQTRRQLQRLRGIARYLVVHRRERRLDCFLMLYLQALLGGDLGLTRVVPLVCVVDLL